MILDACKTLKEKQIAMEGAKRRRIEALRGREEE